LDDCTPEADVVQPRQDERSGLLRAIGSKLGAYVEDRAADIFGRVAEWLNAAVLKTADPSGSVGSNPTPSSNL